MRKFAWFSLLVTSLLVTGCLKSQPSNLAVEVMAKRYWHDQLAMQPHFPIDRVRIVSQFHEASDRYIAVVEYFVTSQLDEQQLINHIQQADAEGRPSAFDQQGVRQVIETLPNRFTVNQSISFTKTLAFADGSRGWLLAEELTRP
ncbi:hypothetical protein [Thiomicrospira sp. ALE5]|uniref:hypothetical protein n=1 Tax=Thiomicrospira sp. ALE5 TaxID=748650 RepID=UPI0008E1D046|nr:hypothetical protein [Thiomicrospira sp. ALE5]SFR60092.1 hypothetical protein SAMN03092900_1571 [Thiomicrospira sp. ALE5]